MSTGDSASSLAAEFPTPTRRQWLLGVAGALKLDPAIVDGDDPESALAKLRSTTLDHIEIEPLYSADDETSDAIGLPGFAPFIRGRRAAGARDTNWDVRQLIDASWPTVDAVGELERGATSLWLDLRHTEVIDVDVLDHVLKGVLLDLAPVVLDAGERWEQAAEAFAALCARRDIRPAAGSSIGADPLGEHASRGGSTTPDLGALVHACASADAVRVIVVDATRYNDAGASDGQELAFVVAAAVEYLRALTSGGVDLATSLAHIELRIAATADQFATVAKIRALRRVWARVAEACGAPEAAAATTIHAVTSRAMMTRYDPWVNSLRTTVACFAAGVAGADSITVLPYDHAAPADGSELGLRLARNTQAVLALESNLARVIDPGGGSWYVEHLTAALAAAAWSDFQEVEAAGGFAVAATSGLIRERLAATWHEREAQIANRSSSITGVSEFPDIDEVIASPPVRGSVAAEALPVHRYAEQFEQLRGRVDHAGAVTRHRPVVFLAALGDLATSTARIAYAKSFFETAGVVTVTGPAGASPAEIIDAFHQSDAHVACLCSSDAFYAEHAVHAAEAIKAAGATYLYLAGRPRALVDQLEQAGVDRLIYTGCDVHATLAELLDVLEVP